MSRFVLPSLFVFFLLTACGEVEDTRPGQPVKTRQQAFKTLLRSFEPMGTMLKDNRYDAERFAQMAQDLVSKRDAPWSHFGPDTLYPPSKSKPEVWSKAAEFETRKQDFIAATNELLTAAGRKEKNAVAEPYRKVYDTCQRCHQDFRER